MTKAKIAITIEDNLLESLDFLVQNKISQIRTLSIKRIGAKIATASKD